MSIYDDISLNYSRKENFFFGEKRRENQNTHFMLSNFFFLKSCRLWDKAEKHCRAGQTTNDNMAHALCMLDN